MPVITITLNKIRAHSPCESGWKKLLKAKAGAGMDVEFPLTDVMDSNGLDDALWCLRVRPEHSKLWRKYAVWCARQVEHLMTDNRSKDALDVAWRHSEGEATDEELAAALAAAWAAAGAAAWAAREAAYAALAASGATRADAWRAARDAWDAWDAVDAAWAAQAQKLREILTKGEW